VQELQMAGINFKAFDLGGHEIARRVWKDYYAKVSWAQHVAAECCQPLCEGSTCAKAEAVVARGQTVTYRRTPAW
jgi:hypothetical protein